MRNYKLSWCGSASLTCPNRVTMAVVSVRDCQVSRDVHCPSSSLGSRSVQNNYRKKHTHSCTVAKMGTFNRLPPISGHFFFARITNRSTAQHQQGRYCENVAISAFKASRSHNGYRRSYKVPRCYVLAFLTQLTVWKKWGQVECRWHMINNKRLPKIGRACST